MSRRLPLLPKNSLLPERHRQDWLLRLRLPFSLKLLQGLFPLRLFLFEKLLHHQHPMSIETQRLATVSSKKTRIVTATIERPIRVDPPAMAETVDEVDEAEVAVEVEVALPVGVEAVRRTMCLEDRLQSVHSVTVQRCEGRGRDYAGSHRGGRRNWEGWRWVDLKSCMRVKTRSSRVSRR